MIKLKGQFNTAKVFTDKIDQAAISQIIELCNQEFCKDSKIRIMPDTHAGAGCTIGTTMTVTDKLVPNLVGVDIGCGMEVVILEDSSLDLAELDKVIREYIPSGFDTRRREHPFASKIDFEALHCIDKLNLSRAKLSVGTLGGGNHFIEVNQDEQGRLYLVIHSGSRYLGKQVAELYQEFAYKELAQTDVKRKELIKTLKRQGRQKDIQAELVKLKPAGVTKELAYLRGTGFEDYLNDMQIVQTYAVLNRQAMAAEIVQRMGLTVKDRFTTIHNYIDLEQMILRKGAISAQRGERVIIPINMRDGSLIAIGKGNADWNFSAPHGAGRLMSRAAAKEALSVKDYKESMEGIFTTCVSQATLDEAPMAYKSMDEIIENTRDTIEIANIIKPIYNFKAS